MSGNIISCKTARSDDLVRVVEVRIETEMPFNDIVDFYKNDFSNNATVVMQFPSFPEENLGVKETFALAMYGENTVGVFIKSKGQLTEVMVQVRGTSIFGLPH